MNTIPIKPFIPALLCVLIIQLASVHKLHCDTMCYSKLLNVRNCSSLNDQLSLDGINDRCDYIEPSSIKELHTQDTDLGVIQLNVRGLLSKQTQIKHLLNNDNVLLPIDVILLCETWLKPSTVDLFDLPNYKSFHKTRKDRIGGGTSTLVNEKLQS